MSFGYVQLHTLQIDHHRSRYNNVNIGNSQISAKGQNDAISSTVFLYKTLIWKAHYEAVALVFLTATTFSIKSRFEKLTRVFSNLILADRQ